MKWSELKRIATQHGWHLLRNGKEHDNYAHPDRDYKIQIPRHDSQEVKNRNLQQTKKTDWFLITLSTDYYQSLIALKR